MTPGLAHFVADDGDPQTWDDIVAAVLAALSAEFTVIRERGIHGAGRTSPPVSCGVAGRQLSTMFSGRRPRRPGEVKPAGAEPIRIQPVHLHAWRVASPT